VNLGASLILLTILGCSGARTTPAAPEASPAPTPAPEQVGSAPVPTAGEGTLVSAPGGGEPASAEPARTPADLYAACRDRIEGPETDGECKSDADCVRAGCSQEVCAPSALAPEIVTTCEMLPCFKAVEACGCHDGRCTWTVREALPGPGKLPLPER
jgi:eight-cysteine-cluster-containing protein